MTTSTPTPELSAAPVSDRPPTPTAAPVRTLGIVSLVLGGASIVLGFGFFVPIAAIVVGILSLRQEPAARGLAIGGIVAAGVAMLGWLLVTLGVLALVPFFGLAAWAF